MDAAGTQQRKGEKVSGSLHNAVDLKGLDGFRQESLIFYRLVGRAVFRVLGK